VPAGNLDDLAGDPIGRVAEKKQHCACGSMVADGLSRGYFFADGPPADTRGERLASVREAYIAPIKVESPTRVALRSCRDRSNRPLQQA